jgi:hypothetical protein
MVIKEAIRLVIGSGLFVAMQLLSLMTVHAQHQRLFLIAGQSNAVGQGDMHRSVYCKPGSAFEYSIDSDSLLPLSDPAGRNELHFEKANTGSISPSFALTYHNVTGHEVIIVSAARGGSSCHEKAELDPYGSWSVAGRLPLFSDAVEKVKRAMDKTRIPLSGIIWLQGERDANAINDKKLTPQEYKEALENLVSRFRKELNQDIPFYIVLTGYYKDHDVYGFNCVRAQQQAIANEMNSVSIVYSDTNLFEERGWMKDSIHYNQQGLNAIGTATAETISKKLN